MCAALITTLDLLRHGESRLHGRFCGRTDAPLTDNGLLQLQRTTDGFCRYAHYELIVSSPLQRCAVFATHLAGQLGITCEIEDALQELDFGQWEGLSTAQVMEQDARVLSRYWQDPMSITPPRGEAYAAFQSRVLHCWQQLLQRYRGRRLLLVTHGGTIRTIVSHVLQIPTSALMRLECANASISRVQVFHDPQQQDTSSLLWYGLSHDLLPAGEGAC